MDVASAAIEFTLAVRNTATESVTLRFRSGRVAEFVVADGATVWRSSNGRFVVQATQRERLDPGETLTATTTWADPISGCYTVEATLEATDVDVSVRAPVEI